MKKLFYWFIFLSPFLMPHTISAKSLNFTVNKSTLQANEEMSVTASASGFTTGDKVYIKGAFYTDGSSNYFGLTKKDDSWVKNSASTTDQRQVTIGSWDGVLSVKSDPGDSGFGNSGMYKFKVGYYTVASSGEVSSINWSDTVVDINLDKPAPTATNTPAPSSSPTPQPSSTPQPTSKPTSSPTKSVTPTHKVTPTEEPTPTEAEDVLGTDTEETPTPTIIETPSPAASPSAGMNTKAIIPLLFVGSGAGLLSAVLFGKNILKKFKKS